MKKYLEYIIENENVINDDTFENASDKIIQKINNFSNDIFAGFKNFDKINNRSDEETQKSDEVQKKPETKEKKPEEQSNVKKIPAKLPTEKIKIYKKDDKFYTLKNDFLLTNPNLEEYNVVVKE